MAKGESVKYDIKTYVAEEKNIVQDVIAVDDLNRRELITRHIIDTKDAQVHATLISLGWRAPGESPTIDVPNDPSRSNPLGLGWRRITATDVLAMEKQLAAVRAALHL